MLDPVSQYAYDVLNHKKIAGKWVNLACKRHFDDLDNAQERGFYFDEHEAQTAIDFFSFLTHSKGEWAGQQVDLAHWQQFCIGSIFGWKRKDGYRRFRTAYEQVARKNGKSTKAAGVGLYGLVADREAGAEVYAAATMKEQARITFTEAQRMVKKSPYLSKYVQSYRNNLSIESTASKFEPLSAEDSTMDGLNVHFAIVDELHAHKTRGVWEVLESAVGARRQPLMYAITTAGFDPTGICYELYEHSKKVLEGVVKDNSFFCYIAQPDEEDQWDDPVAWAKANPNLGISVYEDMLKAACDRAKSIPAARNNFLVKHLNIWTSAYENWITPELWNKNSGGIEVLTDEYAEELESHLIGKECYGGLDLSTTTDLSAFVLGFPEGEKVKIIPYFYLPEEGIAEREKKDRVPYRLWAEQGLLTLTPGDFIDYEFIRRDILKATEKYQLRDIAFDRYNASSFTQDLANEGITMIQHGQGMIGMSPPTKEFMNLLIAGKIEHYNHPILKWMANNVIVQMDAAGNIKPDKSKAAYRIDGIVASIMAISRVMGRERFQSVYETRGVRTL